MSPCCPHRDDGTNYGLRHRSYCLLWLADTTTEEIQADSIRARHEDQRRKYPDGSLVYFMDGPLSARCTKMELSMSFTRFCLTTSLSSCFSANSTLWTQMNDKKGVQRRL